jgi:hypothetical protein
MSTTHLHTDRSLAYLAPAAPARPRPGVVL